MRGPGVNAETPLAADFLHVVSIKNQKLQTESILQFLAPLEQHRGWAGDHDLDHLLAQEQLAPHQPSLNSLPEADIVCDEQVYARQPQSFAQRFKLIRIEANSGPERRLKQVSVGRCDTVPPEGVQVGGESLGWVESSGGN